MSTASERLDRAIATRGLPVPGGVAHGDRVFDWEIRWTTVGPAQLTIPRRQVGALEWIALDRDQAAWIADHGSRWLHEVWECYWEFNDDDSVAAFEAALTPLVIGAARTDNAGH